MKQDFHKLSIFCACLLALAIAPRGNSQTPDRDSQPPANVYPPNVVDLYMKNCLGNRGTDLEAFCTCTIETIQDTYTLNEFFQIGQDLQTGEETPDEFNEIIRSCLTNPQKTEQISLAQ